MPEIHQSHPSQEEQPKGKDITFTGQILRFVENEELPKLKKKNSLG